MNQAETDCARWDTRVVRSLKLCLTVTCATALLAAPRAAAGGEPVQAGAIAYDATSDTSTLGPEESKLLSKLESCHCRVTPVSEPHRPAMERAVAHLADVLADPEVRALVEAKRDWIVEGSEGYRRSRDEGKRLLATLDSGAAPIPVSVLSFGKGPGKPCDTWLASEGVNAFAAIGAKLVLVQESYLELARRDEDPTARTLARTLLHETMHVIGYTHPDSPLDIGGTVYSNTVPSYIGCIAEHYPDLSYVRENCHLPEGARR